MQPCSLGPVGYAPTHHAMVASTATCTPPPRPMAQNRVFFQLSCVLPNENGIRIWNSTWNSRMEYIKTWNIIVHERIANGIHPLFQVKCRLFQVSAPYSRSTTMRYSRILHGIAFVFHSNSFAVCFDRCCYFGSSPSHRCPHSSSSSSNQHRQPQLRCMRQRWSRLVHSHQPHSARSSGAR